MQIKSIAIATPTDFKVGDKQLTTGLFKHAIDGPVQVTPQGLTNDAIINKSVHGGLDQAIYLYRSEDYDWWSEQLGRKLTPGTMGENIMVSGLDDEAVRIGDRLQINNVILELSAPRLPCIVFATKMNDPTFVKKFVNAVRPGAYARVIQAGEINTEDKVTLTPTTENYPTINEVFIESHAKKHSADILTRALAAPVSMLQRPNLQKWLDKLDHEK